MKRIDVLDVKGLFDISFAWFRTEYKVRNAFGVCVPAIACQTSLQRAASHEMMGIRLLTIVFTRRLGMRFAKR
jgi:hypothetical protein